MQVIFYNQLDINNNNNNNNNLSELINIWKSIFTDNLNNIFNNTVDYNNSNVKIYDKLSPEQDNSYDCGLYVIKNILLFIDNNNKNNDNSINLQKFEYNNKDITDLRTELRNLLEIIINNNEKN